MKELAEYAPWKHVCCADDNLADLETKTLRFTVWRSCDLVVASLSTWPMFRSLGMQYDNLKGSTRGKTWERVFEERKNVDAAVEKSGTKVDDDIGAKIRRVLATNATGME